MAKVPFTKLNKIKSIPAKKFFIDGVEIIVEQYLPLSAKLDLIQTVIELSGDGEEGFYNIVKLQTYYTLEAIKAYTNITFTEKQQEDPQKLYDAVVINGLWEKVVKNIPEEEQDYVWRNILSMAREVTDYNHSALGILKAIQSDYGEMNYNIEELPSKISKPENLQLVMDVVKKLD